MWRAKALFTSSASFCCSVESFKPLASSMRAWADAGKSKSLRALPCHFSTSVCLLWRLMAPQKSIQCSLSQQASERWYEARGLLQSLVNVVQVSIHTGTLKLCERSFEKLFISCLQLLLLQSDLTFLFCNSRSLGELGPHHVLKQGARARLVPHCC